MNFSHEEKNVSHSSKEKDKTGKVLITTFAYNEGNKINLTIQRILEATMSDVLLIDDGTTDGSIETLLKFPVKIISNQKNLGIGASMKIAFQYALDHHYDVIVILAGNNKDEPREIPLLLEPIIKKGYDFVQGSRYLDHGSYGNMPCYRVLATKLHPLIFSIAVMKKITESTNGFRAFRTALLNDPNIDWKQDWLNKYELEPYLLYKAIKLKYKHTEVPVTKIYPPKSMGYTKMKAITGWWSILRPVFYLFLGIKK